jgi:hypothetical protein
MRRGVGPAFAVAVAVLSVGAVAAAGLPRYRFHLPPSESQRAYEQRCANVPNLRALLAVPRFGRSYPPVGPIGCSLQPYRSSEKAGWAFVDIQATWHVPNAINGRMAVLGFPAGIYAVGLHTVEFRISGCFDSPCSGKNVFRKTFRQSGASWSNVYAGNTVRRKQPPPPPPPPPPSSQVEYTGKTAQGHPFSLFVTKSAVVNVAIDVDAPCPDGGSVPDTVSFARIPLSSGRFAASKPDEGESIDGQIRGSTITGTVRYVFPEQSDTCDSGRVSFTARKA